jgi:uncharacterized protein YjbI with pentapeptide repeats
MAKIINYITKEIIIEDENLSTQDLVEKAVKEGISLQYADLYAEDLQYTDNINGDFRGCNFMGCDLSNSNFTNCDLTNACFWDANITGIQLNGAILKGAKFDKNVKNYILDTIGIIFDN